MFGHATPESVRLAYADIVKPGVTFKREKIAAIDPANRRVTTDAGTHDADILIIALGADYDDSRTPGIALGENEFYSVRGAFHLRDVVPTFTRGHAVVGVCGSPYKCPPAPSECALMLHDHLEGRGVRNDCHITLVHPMSSPVPPSPDTSKALIAAFAERGIEYLPNHRVFSVDHARHVALIDDGREIPCDLILGVPKHKVPEVVASSVTLKDGWVEVDPRTLETSYPGVYALGDLAHTGAPKAGVFAEGTARTVAANLISKLREQDQSAKYPGAGSCYIEFGGGRVARVDVDFFSGPRPTGAYYEPSEALRAAKDEFGSSRRRRWFEAR
jgi:sulfide:quinone oxidoreductase